MHFIEYIGS